MKKLITIISLYALSISAKAEFRAGISLSGGACSKPSGFEVSQQDEHASGTKKHLDDEQRDYLEWITF